MSGRELFVEESDTTSPPHYPPPTPLLSRPLSPRPERPDSRLLPEALRSKVSWFLTYESGRHSDITDPKRRMPVWAIEIPPYIRGKASFEDKPELQLAKWGLTMSAQVATACWMWKVWSLELEQIPENLPEAKSDFTNQVFHYYTNYTVDEANPSVVMVNEGEGSKFFGDWLQVFNVHCTENGKYSSALVQYSSNM